MSKKMSTMTRDFNSFISRNFRGYSAHTLYQELTHYYPHSGSMSIYGMDSQRIIVNQIKKLHIELCALLQATLI